MTFNSQDELQFPPHGCIRKDPNMRIRTVMNLYYALIETPLGWLTLVGENGALVGISLPKPTKSAAEAGLPDAAVEDVDRFGELPELLRLYFEGQTVSFAGIPVRLDGAGEFEMRVLQETMKIPHGSLTSYKELAALAGSPRAARAVGNAMRRNPIPIVVPCHRVLHSDGRIGGYAGGLDMKRKLLALEGNVL